MKFGYAQSVITPALDHPVYLAGFENNRLAESVHDDLYIRALTFMKGRISPVLCAFGASVTGIVGLANDELGYILPKEDYHYPLNPKNHYEETMSISKEIGPKLVQAVDKILMADLAV